jgi:hypothetical protein
MRLFFPVKTNKTLLNRKDDNYTHYYVNKRLAEGIDFVSLVEGISRKATVEMLIKDGLSKYMAGQLAARREMERKAREQNRKPELTRFVREIRRLAKQRGYDISKII